MGRWNQTIAQLVRPERLTFGMKSMKIQTLIAKNPQLDGLKLVDITHVSPRALILVNLLIVKTRLQTVQVAKKARYPNGMRSLRQLKQIVQNQFQVGNSYKLMGLVRLAVSLEEA
jgi:hypothetical protein